MLGILGMVSSCKSDRSAKSKANKPLENKEIIHDKKEIVDQKGSSYQKENKKIEEKPVESYKKIPEGWLEVIESKGIILDMKYAETDNFTKRKIYDCGRCFLRPEATTAILMIQNELKTDYGYGLKVFDCYRPRPYQQRLWDAVPNPDYVTPPEKGSMHSRGLAVDLTIIDENGDELDMGTPFDYFGKEAHSDYKDHSDEVNKNRKLLKNTMEKYGFKSIRTEWWHYSYRGKNYPLDPWIWDCL